MATSRHSLHSFIPPAAFVPAKTETYARAKQRAALLRRAIVAGLAAAHEAIGPVRVRINAPLIAPPRVLNHERAEEGERRGQLGACLLPPAEPPVERAQAEAAPAVERSHPERSGELPRLLVAGLGAADVPASGPDLGPHSEGVRL